MNIQLISSQGEVLYELVQSELFPDYRSVLREAIAMSVSLENLVVRNENLDNLTWHNQDLRSVSFIDCSMVKTEFFECTIDNISFKNCALDHLKIKKCTVNKLSISESKVNHARIRNSSLVNVDFYHVQMGDASFFNVDINDLYCTGSDLSGSVFKQCNLKNIRFSHDIPIINWFRDVTFDGCTLKEFNTEFIDDISILFFWEVNIFDLDFPEDERITIVETNQTKVIYAIDSDVIWWKPDCRFRDDLDIFRGTLAEFADGVSREYFSKTDYHIDQSSVGIAFEMHLICQYLESWNKDD
ncbi:MAG: pentapeptide repeat-containing protein [Bacteroidota bacterium]